MPVEAHDLTGSVRSPMSHMPAYLPGASPAPAVPLCHHSLLRACHNAARAVSQSQRPHPGLKVAKLLLWDAESCVPRGTPLCQAPHFHRAVPRGGQELVGLWGERRGCVGSEFAEQGLRGGFSGFTVGMSFCKQEHHMIRTSMSSHLISHSRANPVGNTHAAHCVVMCVKRSEQGA